jgi:hypothetical protein
MKPFGPPRRALCIRNCHLNNLITLVIITEIDAKQNLTVLPPISFGRTILLIYSHYIINI